MGIRPRLTLVMGIDDLEVNGYDIVDERMAPPAHAPADLVAELGREWWRGFGCDDDAGRIPLPELTDEPTSNHDRIWLQHISQVSLRHGLIDRQSGKAKTYDDLVFWHSEAGPPNVLGVEIGENNTYNDYWLWALCVTMGDEWMQPGYRVVPSLRLEQDRSYDALALRLVRGLIPGVPRLPASIRAARERHFAARRKAQLLARGWNVPSLTLEIMSWGQYAGYVLRAIGLRHRAADLKLMLVWTWG